VAKVLSNEVIVGEMRIGACDAIKFISLTGTEGRSLFGETPSTLEQTLATQDLMDTPVPVAALVALEDSRDRGQQDTAARRGRRLRPIPPLVIAGPRHLQYRTHHHDGKAGLLGIDKLVDVAYR
jgi:hypothetical protein